MKSERTKKSFLNMSSNFVILIIQTIMSFVVRTYFIRILGEDNLGLDGLFTNILSMLSLTELGVSTAISFILYRPLSDNDVKKVSVIMNFYRKMYILVGVIMLIVGCLLIPGLPFFVESYKVEHMYFIYLLYLISTVSMYFISYKEILIIADQNNYKLSLFNFLFMVLMYLLQIFVLIEYKSFILYLVVMLVVKTLQRVCINVYISKRYKEVEFKTDEKLSKGEVDSLKVNIKSLFFSKIGDYCIYSTDNILISKIINLATVGIYTNYSSIVTMSRSIVNSIFNGITASFGNLAANENEEVQRNVFEIMDFMGFILYGFLTVIYLMVITPFIELWLGKKFVVDELVMVVICINFYLMGTQVSLDTIKQACGFYNMDRYVPLMQAIVNLVLSIILGKWLGLLGILVATSVSYLVLPIWNKPYLVYKYLFKSSCFRYFGRQVKNIVSLGIVYLIVALVNSYWILKKGIVSLIIKCFVVLVVFVIVISIFYFRSKEYQYFLNLIGSVWDKIRGKKKLED